MEPVDVVTSAPDGVLPPSLEFVFELRVSIGSILEIGAGPRGIRRTVPILGGSVSGPVISGCVLPGGADWQLVESDGLTFVDARYVIETEDAVRIEVHNQGIRHGSPDLMDRIVSGEMVKPSEYYFRTTPRFDAPDGKYSWLKRSVFLGTGERWSDLVIVRVWKVV
jgi:hypothetical protein